jgi:putative heme transporter
MAGSDEHGTGPTGASVSAALPAEALGAAPGPRSVLMKVLSAALSGGLVVLLLLVIVPALGSIDGVWTAITSMSAATVALLVIAALVIRVLLAAAYAVILPGLSLWRSLIAREASSAVSNVVPGPSGTATQYVILRSWGVSTEEFAGATISIGVFTDVLVFAAPGIFFVIWVLLGMPASAGNDNVWLIGLGALVVSALAIGILVAVGSSERLAARVGRLGQGCVNPFRRLMGKNRLTDWPERCVGLRTHTLRHVKEHGVGLIGYIAGGYLLNGLLLVWCLWACDIPRGELPLSMGLMLYSVGRLSTVINITPGGVGVAEVAYTAVYVAVLGESAHDSVVAGVLVYRALTYLLPMLTGAASYVLWRVVRHRELRESSVGTRAPD